MATEIEAVIAALKIELQQAEKSHDTWWKAERCNRWIKQLPGAWTLQWNNLKIWSDIAGDVYRAEFITHVKATLAYLETKRAQPQTKTTSWGWPFTALRRNPDQPVEGAAEPIDVEFTDVPTPSGRPKLPKPKIVK